MPSIWRRPNAATMASSKAEVLKQIRYMAEYFYYYAGMADKVEGKVIPTDKEGVFAYTKNEPKGNRYIITPWNSPLDPRQAGSWRPALATGCTAVIKPSEFTSASMIEMARMFKEAGFPDGVVNVVTGFGAEVGVPLVSHPDVAHVGFTGGEAAGIAIYQLAAKGLKTVTLELGGKSPTSCLTTPISTRPSRARSRASSRRRARPASPARACWCRTMSTTNLSAG